MILSKDAFEDNVKSDGEIFRKILADLKANRDTLPSGDIIPDNLDTDGDIEALMARVKENASGGVFGIINFGTADGKAQIIYSNQGSLSGKGAWVQYSIDEDGNVSYDETIAEMRS